MPRAVPLLMVLYSNDAAEIRYSDGFSLQLSACGSTMLYHEATSPRKRGSASTIHKRSRFVTSEHRYKVLQAMDFRNRFAERPYLCEELLNKEQIVALYANVDTASWCATSSEAEIHLLEDGSRKINSLDGYASLIISPHGHDFTVCYLSKISSDNPKPKPSVQKALKSESSQASLNKSHARKISSQVKINNDSKITIPLNPILKCNEAVVHPFQIHCNAEAQLPQPENVCMQSFQNHETCNKLSQDYFLPQTESEMDQLPNLKAGFVPNSGKSNFQQSTDAWAAIQIGGFQNDSATSQMREHQVYKQSEPPFSNSSINSHDISSISRSSTPDGLRMTIDSDASLRLHDKSVQGHEPMPSREVYRQRHSSPTQFTSSPLDQANHHMANQLKGSQFKADRGLEVSYLRGNFVNNAGEQRDCSLDVTLCEENYPAEELSRTVVGDRGELATSSPSPQNLVTASVRVPALGREKAPVDTVQVPCASSCDVLPGDEDKNNANSSSVQISNPFNNSPHKSGTQLTTRHPEASDSSEQPSYKAEGNFQSVYVWTTTHVSRNVCPPAWTHPLKLVQAAHSQQEHLQQESSGEIPKSEPKGKQSCSQSSLPMPLPVTCPFQHLHKWDAEKTLDVSDATGSLEFQHGMLKVVISEGIVYRFVTVAKIHIVEIHPGDGSIVVSQGVKGHFYTHYVIAGDRLEERTYSLKSLPPVQRKGSYSISKLIQTGNRYLMMNQQWERRGLKEELPCWKREMVAVVEPLSSSLLEECIVDGLGKFSAFTNGRVRAVFEDRTALDMVCNFSKRVSGNMQRGQETKTSLPAASQVTSPVSSYEAIFGASSARLLLPSGQYVTVDIQNPGQYKNYIQAGSEWASWVNSTPMERHQFYTRKHEPTVMLRAAEHELKKIFCFNYILEQTLRMQQDSSSFNKGPSLSPPRQNSLSHSSSLPTAVHNAVASSLPHSFTSLTMNSQPSHQNHPKTKDISRVPTLLPHEDPVDQSEWASFSLRARNKNQNNWQRFAPISHYSYVGGNQITPSSNTKYAGISVDQLSDNSPDFIRPSGNCNNSMLNPRMSREKQSVATQIAQSDERAQSITEGFQAVRQVLLKNSNLINDIDEFLDNSRKQCQ